MRRYRVRFSRPCAGVDVTMPFRPFRHIPHEKRVEVAVPVLWCSLVYSILSALVVAILSEPPWIASQPRRDPLRIGFDYLAIM
jgi:hypothetical protein